MVRRVRECCNPIVVGQKTHPRLLRKGPNRLLRLFLILLPFQKLMKDILYALDGLRHPENCPLVLPPCPPAKKLYFDHPLPLFPLPR